MNALLWAWALDHGWKLVMQVLREKEFGRRGAPFENDARLNNREPVKRFQKWDGMRKPRRPCETLAKQF